MELRIQSGAPVPPAPTPQVIPFIRPIPACPPGLEYLTQIDALFVVEEIDELERKLPNRRWNIEVGSRYCIFNKIHERCYFAYEEKVKMKKCCRGNNRGFIFHVSDNLGTEVMRVTRPFKLCAFCCPCLAMQKKLAASELIVEAPPGTQIGKICQTCSCLIPRYTISDGNGSKVFEIRGPCYIKYKCDCCMCAYNFDVVTMSKPKVIIGGVSLEHSSYVPPAKENATVFNVDFPMDLDAKMKACVLAFTFICDVKYFQD